MAKRNLAQSSMLMASMLAAAMSGLPSAIPCIQTPKLEIDPEQQARDQARRATAEIEAMDKAEAKRKRKANNKTVK